MASIDTTSDNESPEQKKAAEEVRFWLNEISAAHKRDKEFLKEGRRILDIYDGGAKEQKDRQAFPILYSNTETMLPALYSAVPRPVVQRRFKDDDPLGKLAAQAGQRALEFVLDTNIEGYETYDEGVRSTVMSGLLPGRGIAAVKYDHETVDVDQGEGKDAIPYMNWETVCIDTKPWDRFLHGYAKKWSQVPWIAYELHLDREEARKAGIPDDLLAKIEFTKGEDTDEHEDTTKKADSEQNLGEAETALFYQIWDKKGGRKVRYLCPQYKEALCAVQDDPLGLTGFFNTPKPITFVERVDDLTPVPLYALYENQANEVNKLTIRIKHLIAAIKATAAYDGELGDDLKKLLDADEGQLFQADKGSSLAAEKGFDNAIWFWPVDKLIVVLKELYVARESAKAVIYEITGISDIIRGSTKASETATAQQIKSQWGTLRLKRPQKEVQRYCRDLLRMMLDVAAHKFQVKTFAQMTGLPFVTEDQMRSAQQVAQMAQLQGQQPDPQTVQTLQAPVWEKVLSVLQDDYGRAYRIDIETNSTVEPEATEDREMIAEVMNALGQLLNGLAPLVEKGVMPFEAAQAMMLAIVRRFRFGPEIEDYIKAMKQPAPQDDGKAKAEEAKRQMEQEKHQFEMQQMDKDAQHKRELEALKLQVAQIEAQMEMQKMQRDDEFQQRKHQRDLEKMAAQAALQREKPKTQAGAN